jgi:hypothetical protein
MVGWIRGEREIAPYLISFLLNTESGQSLFLGIEDIEDSIHAS